MPLTSLPLRPSTLTLLKQKGFVHLDEVWDSKESGGFTTLAAELHLELPKAMRIWNEIQDCLTASTTRTSGAASTSTTSAQNSDESTSTGTDSQPQQPPPPHSTSHNDSSDAMLFRPPPMFSADDILNLRHQHVHGHPRNANKNNQNQASTTPSRSFIVTFCQAVDSLLGGGIPLGSVTEVAGLPGVGKTQWGMQLSVTTRLPKALGGVQGQTIYIDAEGSLVPERLQQMGQALLDHTTATLQRRRQRHPNKQQHSHTTLPPHHPKSVDQVLQGIHVFRVHDEASQTATLYSLPHWIESLQRPDLPVKLIVIDSIAFHYRAMAAKRTTATTDSSFNNHDFYLQRTKALQQMASFLGDVARKYHVAVVCINQMTTKFQHSSTGNMTRLVPALGESWAHAVSTRLLLSQQQQQQQQQYHSSDDSTTITSPAARTCTLVKSPCMPSGTAYYQVTPNGIRGVVQRRSSSNSTSSTLAATGTTPTPGNAITAESASLDAPHKRPRVA